MVGRQTLKDSSEKEQGFESVGGQARLEKRF